MPAPGSCPHCHEDAAHLYTRDFATSGRKYREWVCAKCGWSETLGEVIPDWVACG